MQVSQAMQGLTIDQRLQVTAVYGGQSIGQQLTVSEEALKSSWAPLAG